VINLVLVIVGEECPFVKVLTYLPKYIFPLHYELQKGYKRFRAKIPRPIQGK
jgi:hypothetical protein